MELILNLFLSLKLPPCDHGSGGPVACGRVQVNLQSVTPIHLCHCGDERPQCPMQFDAHDGQTAFIGAEQQLKVINTPGGRAV